MVGVPTFQILIIYLSHRQSLHLLWQSRHLLNTVVPSSADLTCFAMEKDKNKAKITRDVHEEVKKTILEDNQLPNPYPMCNSTTPTPSSTSYIPSSTPSTPSPTGDPTPCTHSHTTRSNDTYVYRVHTTLSLKIKNSSMKKRSTTKTTSHALDFM